MTQDIASIGAGAPNISCLLGSRHAFYIPHFSRLLNALAVLRLRKVYVAGVGMVRVDRHFDKGLGELAYEAVKSLVNDVKSCEPQAIVVGNMLSSSLYQQDSLAALIADHVGLRGRGGFKVEASFGSGGHAVVAGYALIASGVYDEVLVIGVEKMCDYPNAVLMAAMAQALDAEHEMFYGISVPALYALLMRLYMQKYEVKREDLSIWPVRMHEYASKNPYAQLRSRITVDDVLKSPVLSEPIRLLDMAPVGDGAAAILLASEDLARNVTETPIEVVGVGLGTGGLDLSSREDLLNPISIRAAAEKAFRMAKLEPSDVDVAEVHDDFTITPVISIEALGFAEPGTSWRLLKEGRFGAGDRPSLNLSGGLKARGHPLGATGVYQVAELAMQLRGDFPGVKAQGAEVALALNIGGIFAQASVVLLKR